MRGLRKQEDPEFERFFEIIQEAAGQKNAVFFGDSGEGRDIVLDGISGEDIGGWLIPEQEADTFEKSFKARTEGRERQWDKYYCFAEWELVDGKIKINFVWYNY